ncbi:MAG: TIGR03619 family F420-dependent LLM class oxidoreductase [Candidatus Binatia bacterium]|nr:TIGR03619 family F420-dependent LLM class oxidoreductase [Candidatus Binatia bacterium]
MKVGVSVFLTDKSGNPGEIARTAENLGFESMWVAEHIAVPTHYTTYYPRSADGKVPEFYAYLVDPLVALAAAAQTTTTIRLGTAIYLLPQHDVIATAKATATLDRYSNGRLIFGVGAGWFAEEAQLFGVQFKRRWHHLREAVEALRELWSSDEPRYEGTFVKFPPIRIGPKPLQKPFPPIFLGAHDPRYAPKRVARYADGWFPANLSPEQFAQAIPEIKRQARDLGRDPERLEFSVLLMAQGDGPSVDTMKRYQEAGVHRVIVLAWAAASGSGVEAVKGLAPVVERAQHV